MGQKDYEDYLHQVVMLVKNTPMVFYVIGRDWTFKLSEGAGLSKLGLEPGQVVGMKVEDVYGGNDELMAGLKRAFIGEASSMYTPVGNTTYESYLIPFYDDNDELEGIIGVAVDVTQRFEAQNALKVLNATLEDKVNKRTKALLEANEELTAINEEMLAMNEELNNTNKQLNEMQDYLVESEKMAALGTLVAGVAHEVNTPIGVSITAATHLSELAKEIISQKEKGKIDEAELAYLLEDLVEASDMIERNLGRASDLIRSFKQLSVDQSIEEVRVFEIGSYTQETILSLEPKYKHHHINTEVKCMEAINVKSSAGAYAQIVTNLYFNALQHAFVDREAGHILIKIERVDTDIVIEFSDDGIGMSSEVVEKIFNPFYTTKRNEGGTGLGMSIVYTLVTQKCGGTITCQSKVDQGTCFTIKVPFGGDLDD